MQVSEAHIIRSVCRESFREFVKQFIGTIIPGPIRWNWHLDVICDELQEIAERIFRNEPAKYNLVCNISPGTTKSTIFSILFPIWCWTRLPSFRTIGVSYNERLAMDLSRRSRDVALSEKFRMCFPEIVLRDDQSTKSHFQNTLGGMRYCAGAEGGVTGMHGHVIIIDDPINPLQSVSELEMANVNYWIKQTLWNRVVDKAVAVRILVMQRLAQDDPTNLFTAGDQRVRWLRIPATDQFDISPPELKEYYVDGLMDPVGMNWDFINETRGPLGMGEAGFSSQYGQSPVPMGGGMFKTDRLKIGPLPEKWKRLCRGWDKAVTPSKGSLLKGAAFTVGALLGVDLFDNIWIIDIQRERLDSYMRENLIARMAKGDGKVTTIAIEKEPGSGGTDSAEATAKRLMGYRVKLLPASGSKESRADAFSHAVNAGIVYIPDRFRIGNSWTGWAIPFVDEMMHWPQSTFLDQIDAAASAFTVVAAGRIRVGAIKPREFSSLNNLDPRERVLYDKEIAQRRTKVKSVNLGSSEMVF